MIRKPTYQQIKKSMYKTQTYHSYEQEPTTQENWWMGAAVVAVFGLIGVMFAL